MESVAGGCAGELAGGHPRRAVTLCAAADIPAGPSGALADRADEQVTEHLSGCGTHARAIPSAAAWTAAGAACWRKPSRRSGPARQALLPALVTPDRADSASALAGTALLLGMTAGSALGGVLTATAGFAVNAASFLPDVALLHAIQPDVSPLAGRAPRRVRDGLAYVWRAPYPAGTVARAHRYRDAGVHHAGIGAALIRTSFGGSARLLPRHSFNRAVTAPPD